MFNRSCLLVIGQILLPRLLGAHHRAWRGLLARLASSTYGRSEGSQLLLKPQRNHLAPKQEPFSSGLSVTEKDDQGCYGFWVLPTRLR